MLLIALTLIILKLGFLLLLVAGPFFLIVGVHPGFGRVVAIRWFEMLVGVLLKQVAVALVLSILLYCYSLIMGTTDQELPWGLKIMMISLVTVAVFIYRKPFQHLFSSVGYGMLGANERAEVSWRESAFGFRRVSATAAGTVVPGAGGGPARPVGRAAPRRMASAGPPTGRRAVPDGGGVRATSSDGMSVMPTADSHSASRQWPAGRRRHRPHGPAAAAVDQRRPAVRERRPGGLGQERRRQHRHRSARSRAAAGPPDRADASRAHVGRAHAAAGPPDRAAPTAPTQSPPPPAPTPPATPFWSRSRRRPQ